MADHISRNQTSSRILIAITVVGLAVAIVGYSYLIASNCGSSGVNEFFSAARTFHTQAGCGVD